MSTPNPIPDSLRSYVEALEPTESIWINGKGQAADSGATFVVYDPATTLPIVEVSSASESQARAAVDAAAAAFPTWRKTAARERSEILRRAFELMLRDRDELAALMAWENGKSLADGLGEASYAAEFFRWFSEEAVRSEGDFALSPSGSARMVVSHQPVGVSALITPWNFPAAMATRKIAPALAAGCTVVLKAASETPLTALAIVRLLHEAGVPAGVVNLVPSSDSSMVSSTWLDDPRVRMLSFTGSTQVGKILMRQATERVMNVSMELGGNASFIVGPSADVQRAVDGAMQAKFRNGGQACTAANRFYVHRSVAQEFVEEFGKRISHLHVGPAFKEGTDIGPVASAKAHSSISGLLERAAVAGCTVVAQTELDSALSGYFIAPTLLAVEDPHAEILQTEIFGPVAPVIIYDDEEQMLEWVNGTEFGLTSYVFGEDLAWALRISERIEAGMIGINRGMISDPAAPFGGMKESGIGREGAREGIREFQETQYFSIAP